MPHSKPTTKVKQRKRSHRDIDEVAIAEDPSEQAVPIRRSVSNEGSALPSPSKGSQPTEKAASSATVPSLMPLPAKTQNWPLVASDIANKKSSIQKPSQKSIYLMEKPLRRVVSSSPPTTSVNELLNHDVLSLPVVPQRSSHSRRSLKKSALPHGSMESVVCGAAAKEVGGLHEDKQNFLDSPIVSIVDPKNDFARSVSQSSGINIGGIRGSETQFRGPDKISDTAISLPASHRLSVSRQTIRSLPPTKRSGSQHTVNPLVTIKRAGGQQALDQSNVSSNAAWFDRLIDSVISLSWTALLSLLVGISCVVAIATVSSLFCGILCGSFLMYVILRTYTWLLNPDVVFVYLPTDTSQSSLFKNVSLRNLPRNPNDSAEERVREYKGWMNLLESEEYDPQTYHISNTETVFVILEGTTLRMKKPLDKDIPKRAVWNEAIHSTSFVQQIQVDVTNFVVNMKPSNLSIARLYSKRFPICLTNKRSRPSNETTLDGSLFHNQDSDKSKQGALKAIILFARTSKEKEEWFRRLEQASRGYPVTTMGLELQRLCAEQEKKALKEEVDKAKLPLNTKKSSPEKFSNRQQKKLLFVRDHTELLIDYMKYMTSVIRKSSSLDEKDSSRTAFSEARKSIESDISSIAVKKGKSKLPLDQPSQGVSTDPDTGTMWINVMLQRIFFDFFREEYWRNKMHIKLQKKLDKIALPYYLGSLVIDKFSLGTSLPLLKRIGQPYLSDDGLWIDSELGYSGGVCMTIETKINLNVLKKEEKKMADTSSHVTKSPRPSENSASDDSSTSSAESLPPPSPLQKDPKTGEHKMTKFFNSLKESRYFQKLADTKLIKSAMDKVSKTPLKLSVEVKYVAGIFSISIPPPPTDRIWFGFRKAPEVILTATPIIGAKSVNLSKLSTWIEDKLTAEFHRELVIPNMIDRQVPIMCGNYELVSRKASPPA